MLRFSGNVGLRGAIICYISWTFCTADVTFISQPAGSTVILNCNTSVSNFIQLMWDLNGTQLFVFAILDNGSLHKTPAATRLNLELNLNRTGIQPYALIIEGANESHSGNYTCEKTTSEGFLRQKWKLFITERPESISTLWYIIVPIGVVLSCVLFLAVCVFFLRRSSKQKPKKIIRSLRPNKQQAEVVYENCLEIERYHDRQP